METLNYICIAVAALAICASIITIWLNRKRTRKTLDTLDNMLSAAIDGSFSETTFDESQLSAVETKLARYLSVCSASSKNLLAERNKINELVADVSHQTKTPISNILLYSQLLSERELPEDCTSCVNELSAQAEKLSFLISSLVKLSRLETGIITVIPKREPISALLDEVYRQILPKAEAKSISVNAEKTSISALFDMKWTVEAVYNIADNAVKYTAPGGSISLRATAYELFCRIDVTDNGIGIAEEEHSKIFKRFYRSASVSAQEGVGIGLFLAREILSAEGGYIKVVSKLGCGSTFSIFLPMKT